MRAYQLEFLSALHVDSKGSGQAEVSDDFIRSDTLSAALCLARSALYPELTGPESFTDPPVKVSSAFPFAGDLLLFPVPAWPIWREMEKMNSVERKKFKKVKWISKGVFEAMRSGTELASKDAEILPGQIAVLPSERQDWLAPGEFSPWMSDERQRVAVDRLGLPEGGDTFFFSLQWFAPDCGLWFMAQGDEPELDRLDRVLDYLGDTGLGADRNSGLGHFQVKATQTLHWDPPSEASGWITLSLFNPGDEEVDQLTENSAYGLIRRSGWIFNTTFGRPPVRAFTEGSYFPVKPQGRVVDSFDPNRQKQWGLPHAGSRDFRAMALPCAQPRYLKEGNQ